MKKLIEALTIFAKYKNLDYPTYCEHDVLYVVGISCEEISTEDHTQLAVLGFIWAEEADCWQSFRFGSA